MNFTNVPDSCIHSQPRSIASFSPAPYSAGEPPSDVQERLVDLLDVDAAVLHRLDRIGDLEQFSSGSIGVSEGAGAMYFIAAL